MSATKLESVVVAVDGSPASDAALRWAAHLAARHRARLYLFHAVSQGEDPGEGPSVIGENGEPCDLLVMARNLVARELGLARSNDAVPVEVCRRGAADEEVSAFASEVKASLVVVGTSAREGLDRMIHGSVAESIWRRSRRPVLVVRAGLAPPTEPCAKVLVALDGSPDSATALRAARAFAGDQGAIEAVHVLETSAASVVGAVIANESASDPTAAVHDQLDQWVRDALGDAVNGVTTTLLFGSPAAELEKLVLESAPEIVACGTRGRTGLARLVLGSVAEALVHSGPCPVLLCPPGSQAA